MARFELTGSGISDATHKPETLLETAKRLGLRNPRLAYHMGWSNQPMTVRFSAPNWDTADKQAEKVRAAFYPECMEGRLCPMIRAYPAHKLT